ncbi:MAG: hypothetical protein FJ264_16965 [Planctomycetes bacterium]|nr:hypothetical protein [Planctomycetota bacterium]
MPKNIKERIIKEVAKIPDDKIVELYDVIHFFRIGVETQRKIAKDSRKTALNFFGIWKDMPYEEAKVLDEIQSRREKTFRKRTL